MLIVNEILLYQPFIINLFTYFTGNIMLKSYFYDIQYLMALPLDSKNRFNRKKRLIQNRSQFLEGWAGVGIIVGIWAITFGIIASGILKF